MNLKEGSQITLNVDPESEVQLRCGGVPMFAGSMGRNGNRIAVQIARSLHNGGGLAGELAGDLAQDLAGSQASESAAVPGIR